MNSVIREWQNNLPKANGRLSNHMDGKKLLLLIMRRLFNQLKLSLGLNFTLVLLTDDKVAVLPVVFDYYFFFLNITQTSLYSISAIIHSQLHVPLRSFMIKIRNR